MTPIKICHKKKKPFAGFFFLSLKSKANQNGSLKIRVGCNLFSSLEDDSALTKLVLQTAEPLERNVAH